MHIAIIRGTETDKKKAFGFLISENDVQPIPPNGRTVKRKPDQRISPPILKLFKVSYKILSRPEKEKNLTTITAAFSRKLPLERITGEKKKFGV